MARSTTATEAHVGRAANNHIIFAHAGKKQKCEDTYDLKAYIQQQPLNPNEMMRSMAACVSERMGIPPASLRSVCTDYRRMLKHSAEFIQPHKALR